ncbi:MAG: TonB-dependent siderophore receptor [Acidovorax sp.]|uniref:TonB-dependent siderophore receptor n=1 Tax=Acidovorax sp. TaxID=1872122 RepID=UPI0039E57CF1
MARRHHHVLSHAARAALLSLACAAAAAQAQPAPAAPAPEAQQEYRIAPGPLQDALARFATEAGISLNMPQPLVQGRSSPGLQGRFGVREGLARLLAGTGLEAEARTPGVYVLRAVPEARSAAPATLGEVRVTADAVRGGVTEGSGSYAARSASTATGLDLSARETPQSVSVITQERIEDQALASLAETIRSAPGVSYRMYDRVRGAGGSARGFGISNYQIDGLPTVVDIDLGIDSASTAMYDRVEIVRGATGLRSGAGDPAATVNFVRKHADSKVFTGSLALEAGSWNRRGGTADLSTPLNADGSVRARLVVSYRDQDGFVDLERSRTTAFYGVVDADLGDRTRLSIGASDQHDDRRSPLWFGLPAWYADGTRTDWPRSKTTQANWSYWNNRQQSVFAALDHRLGGGWSVQASAQHQRAYEVASVLGLEGAPDRATGLGMTTFPFWWDGVLPQTQLNVQASGPFELFGRRHELTVGALHWRSSMRWDFANDTAEEPAAPGDFNQWNGSYPVPVFGARYTGVAFSEIQSGIYGAARLNLSEPFKLIVGGRLSRYQRRTETTAWSTAEQYGESAVFTPYVGALYDINAWLTAYAGYTSIFKPQNLRTATGGYLAPLQGHSYEAGLKSEFFDGALNAALAVFRIEQDNYGVLDGDAMVPGTADPAYRAVRGVKSQGYELEVTGSIRPRWDVSLGWTAFSAKDHEGQPVQNQNPTRMLKLYTKYQFDGALSGLSVGGGVDWQNDMPDWRANPVTGARENVGQSAFATVGLMARYQISKPLSVQVNVYNLLDKKYYDGTGSGTYLYGEPRRVAVQLKYRF